MAPVDSSNELRPSAQGYLRDLFWYVSIHITNPTSDIIWREWRVTRMLGRGEISIEQAMTSLAKRKDES